MTKQNEEYEFARKIIKREAKRPSAYTNNRHEAVLARVQKEFCGLGDKAVRELGKEFKKELRISDS